MYFTVFLNKDDDDDDRCLLKVMQLFLFLNFRIEVKQRNFDDLMYDLQSLKEKNERLKDRVRDI